MPPRPARPTATPAVGDRIVDATERPDTLSAFLVGVPYWTTHRIHYDQAQAQAEGFDGVVITGPLMYGWVERELVQWSGDPSGLRRFNVRHHNVAVAGDELRVTATVSAVQRTDAGTEVECDVAIHRGADSLLTGAATMLIKGG